MSTRHIAAEDARLADLTPEGSSSRASKRFRHKLAADGFTVDDGFRLKTGYLYTVVRAISARVNQNYDGWPSDELKKSYKTFIGKPVFVNHENHDPTKARGVVVAARYVENGMDKYIEVVQEIDANRFPKLAREIKTGGLDSVSMGAEAGFTICSYCKNKATDLHDMCDHVKNHKGKTLTKFDRRTGNKEDILVFESCHKISFFELSYVFEPADETAVASKVVVAGKHAAADDLAVPAPPGTKTIDQSVIDSTPVVNLSPATELNGHEAPGVKQSGKYTKEDFAAAGGKKPWETGPATTERKPVDPDALEIEAMVRTADLDDINLEIIKQAGDCPPGMDCSRNIPQGEQIYKDSPNNPVNQATNDPDGTGAGYAGGGGKGGSSPSSMDVSKWKSADEYAKAMGGKPYNYGGHAANPGGVDCSGYMSDIYSIYSGKPTHFTTDSDFAALGFKPGYQDGAFNIGTNGGVGENGHMAGTLPDGTNVESNGSAGVQYGGNAAGATDKQFSQQWHYPVNNTPTTGVAPATRDAARRVANASDDYWAWKAEHGDEADREHGTGVAPQNRALQEWARQQSLKERKLRASKKSRQANLADDYMDYMYGEYGGNTSWEVPKHPMDIMYDEAHHGRGRDYARTGPSGPNPPISTEEILRRGHKTAAENIPPQLHGLVDKWTPYVNNDKNVNPQGLPAEPPDPNQPVFVHFQIPAADRQRKALRHHLNNPNDPDHDPSRPSLSREEASRLAEQPDLWSVEQTDPATGKRAVRGHTNQLHLTNASFDMSRSGQRATQVSGDKGVHGGVSGYMSRQPNEPLTYSNVEYNPFVHMDFVHRDDQTPVGDPDEWQQSRGVRSQTAPKGFRSNGTADHVHLSPDMSMYASRADNFGREPSIVFPPHPSVNVANPDTVIPGIKPPSQHPEVARRSEAVMEKRRKIDQARGRTVIQSNLKQLARAAALKLAFGETEAPVSVNTMREEGSAPEDDNNDDEQYVDPADDDFASNIQSPADLRTPDLSQAAQIDREQEAAGASADQMGGVPGAADPSAMGGQPQPQQQYMTLQIPIPAGAPQVPQQAAPPVMAQPPMPPQGAPQGPPQQIAASVLDYFDRYYGHRVANWYDAIEAGREMNPAEAADYRRQTAKLSTLENRRELSTTDRNPTKGTANMARSTIASRNKVATAGRRQHFAEGPLVDSGDLSRNDQGEQEEAFISQTPPAVAGDFPTDDTPNISNTENTLVARVQRGRAQLLRDAQALASLRQRRAFDEAGGPTADLVDPTVNTGPEGEALTGDNFISADPNDGVVETQPKDASLKAFAAFDGWLTKQTGKSSRRHSEATIKKAAAQFSREAGISPQMLFPALGIVLREARKNDKQANTKGAKMRKRADEKLEVAAPDGRVDVEAPVENTTSAEAQASQPDLRDFANNAGDNIADPDLSTDQNWAPGEASKTSAVKLAGGLLAMRCAEGMIEAGLEPNSRERKYQLAAEFERMNRGLIQDRVALLERFAAVRQADLRRVASGSSRGAARSPIPAGLGGGTRTASAGQRVAAHDPSNDSGLFI